MKVDPKVLDYLNTVLTNELTAINQSSCMRGCWTTGASPGSGSTNTRKCIDEMRHADSLVKRILFLEGLPNLQRLNALLIGQRPEEVLRCDMTWKRKR